MGGVAVNQQQRWEWLSRAAGEESARGVGRALGVSHTTVQRWVQKGMPDGTLIDLIVRFNQDPLEACVVWGLLNDADVPKLNWAAVARYIPADVLTAELHDRARLYIHANYSDALRKTSVWDTPRLHDHPARSDSLERQSFRLTAK